MSATNIPFSKIIAWSVGLSATIYTIFQYGLKLFKVYNGEYVTSVTGMDALVIELISFFMTAIVIGWLMLRKPQENFGKQLLQISAIIIFAAAMGWLMYSSSNGEILNFTILSILIASTITKVQIARSYQYKILNLLVYPFFLIVCLVITFQFLMQNEFLSQHLLSIDIHSNPLEADSIFTDTLWALLYYISIGILLPLFHIIRKLFVQSKIR